MSHSKFIWCLKFLGCVLLVYFVINAAGPLRNVLWWMLHEAGRTAESRWVFGTRIYLIFCAVLGGLLGLIPFHLLSDLLNAVLGRLHRQPAKRIQETDLSRPVLWTWAFFVLIWVPRVVFYRGSGESVFGGSAGISRWDYFFGDRFVEQFSLWDPFSLHWGFERTMVTGPLLFSLSYAITAIIRIFQTKPQPIDSGESIHR